MPKPTKMQQVARKHNFLIRQTKGAQGAVFAVCMSETTTPQQKEQAQSISRAINILANDLKENRVPSIKGKVS